MGNYGTVGVRAQGGKHMKGGYVSRQSHTDSAEPPQGRLRRVCTFSHFQMGKLRMRVAEIVQVAAIWLASLSSALWKEGSDFLPSLSPKHPQLSFVSLLFPLFPWFLLVCTVRFGPGNCMVGLHSGGPWGLQSHCPWRTQRVLEGQHLSLGLRWPQASLCSYFSPPTLSTLPPAF